MKHRVLPVLVQAFLIVTVATSAWAQLPSIERMEEWQSRSSDIVGQLSAHSRGKTLYGLTSILRKTWGGSEWLSESQTTHSYAGIVRRETVDSEWGSVQWLPTYRTTYRSDGLIDLVEEWDAGVAGYSPSARYLYDFVYDFPGGYAVPGSILKQVWNGRNWEPSERTTNTISSQSTGGLLVVGSLEENWDGAGWIPTWSYKVEEVEEDVVQTSRVWDAAAQDWSDSERTTFRTTTIAALNQRFKELASELADYSDLSIGLLMVPDYEAEAWSENDGWRPVARKVTTHFDFRNGKPAVVDYETWFSIWTVSMRQEITYSTDGVPEKSTLVTSSAGITQVLDESYTYDGRGVMTEAVKGVRVLGNTLPVAGYVMGWTELSVGNDADRELPVSAALGPAYPNPFNPSTRLVYELNYSDRLAIDVFDMLGRRVVALVDDLMPAGRYEVLFDAEGLPGGLYSIRMHTSRVSQSRIVALIK